MSAIYSGLWSPECVKNLVINPKHRIKPSALENLKLLQVAEVARAISDELFKEKSDPKPVSAYELLQEAEPLIYKELQ